MKKKLIILCYFLAVVGLGTGSLLVGQRISDTQRKVTPQKAAALGEQATCMRCCYEEEGPDYSGLKNRCGGCALRKNCSGKNRPEAVDCWAGAKCVPCEGLSANNTNFEKGQEYKFTCKGKCISGVAHIDRYQYRYKIDNEAWKTKTNKLSKAQRGSAFTLHTDPIGFTLKVNKDGKYIVQCRPCAQLGCGAWETL